MGRLVVIDGLDGSGKSTQLARLNEYLSAAGVSYKQISFPDYAQPSSALVKMYLAGELGGSADAVNAYAASSFYAVDRYASYKRFWQADYEAGALIVAARYATSNAIHQMAKLPPEEWDGYLAWLEDYEYRLLGCPGRTTSCFSTCRWTWPRRCCPPDMRETKRKRTSTRGTACTCAAAGRRRCMPLNGAAGM